MDAIWPLIGSSLGPYSIESKLGSGGMGTVYRAMVERSVAGLAPGDHVALKVMHPHLFRTEGFFKWFLREAEIGKRVDHPNIVRTLDVDALFQGGQSYHFLVMELVDGQTLRALLEELERAPEELCRHIGREVAAGLAAIHEAGVIHRDLKPENILITADHVVKVMDLGVARLADEAMRLSQAGDFAGSFLYAAPEQLQGEAYDHRADLYALGLVLYELATGRLPFVADDFRAVMRRQAEESPQAPAVLNPQLSPFFDEVIQTLLARDRGGRFASASELLDILEEGEQADWWRDRATGIRTATRRPLRRIRVPRETALYGREDELAELRAMYESAKRGEGRVVLVEGEAGIGKTRLVDEFVGGLEREGENLNFLFGSYPPGGAATAAGAFTSAYRAHFGEEGLEDTLRDYLSDTPLLAPALAALLRGESTTASEQPLTKESLLTAFVHATRSLARERPTIVLIDDLHFAPEEGRALFAALALAAPGHRILLIGTAGRGVPEEWAASLLRMDAATRMPVLRLGPKHLGLLLIDAFGSERLAKELGLQIATKSDGNPFFVFEIIRGLREGQLIRQRPDGTWDTTQAIRDIQIPSSVLDLVQARISDLSEEEREILDVASCCGFEFDPLLIGETLNLPSIPLLRALGRIERTHNLVRAVGPRCAFDHHQVQEALYGSLSELLRREYHGALGDALERRAKVQATEKASGEVAVGICGHFLASARPESARRHLDGALQHLEASYQGDQTIALAGRALDIPDLLTGEARVKVLLRLCRCLDLLGRRDAQCKAAEEAVEAVEQVGDAGLARRAALEWGWSLFRTSKYDEAQGTFEGALEAARTSGDSRAEAKAAGKVGAILLTRGRHEEARPFLERVLAISRELGDRNAEGRATGNLGNIAFALAQYEEALELYERCLEVAKETGDRQSEAHALGNLGTVYWARGDMEQAEALFERDLELVQQIGDREGEAVAAGNLGAVLSIVGRHEDSKRQSERALALSKETGSRWGEAKAIGNLGSALVAQGRQAEGLERFEAYLALCGETGDRREEGHARRSLGGLLLMLGRNAEARDHLQRALELSREAGDLREEGKILQSLADLAAVEGDREGAERLYREVLAHRHSIGHMDGEAETLHRLGELLAASDRLEQARAVLDEAATLAKKVDDPRTRVLAACQSALLPGGDAQEAVTAFQQDENRLAHQAKMHACYLLWKATGDPDHLEKSHDLLVYLLDHGPRDVREAGRESVPMHREIASAWRALR
ncbi:MAG: serine/threonine-protein kinase [Planctomycetota bacterium]